MKPAELKNKIEKAFEIFEQSPTQPDINAGLTSKTYEFLKKYNSPEAAYNQIMLSIRVPILIKAYNDSSGVEKFTKVYKDNIETAGLEYDANYATQMFKAFSSLPQHGELTLEGLKGTVVTKDWEITSQDCIDNIRQIKSDKEVHKPKVHKPSVDVDTALEEFSETHKVLKVYQSAFNGYESNIEQRKTAKGINPLITRYNLIQRYNSSNKLKLKNTDQAQTLYAHLQSYATKDSNGKYTLSNDGLASLKVDLKISTLMEVFNDANDATSYNSNVELQEKHYRFDYYKVLFYEKLQKEFPQQNIKEDESNKLFDAMRNVSTKNKSPDGDYFEINEDGIARLQREPTVWQKIKAMLGFGVGKAKQNFKSFTQKILNERKNSTRQVQQR